VSWEPVDLAADQYAQPSEPPEVFFLYRGKRHAIVGPPESLKTLVAAVLGLEWMRTGRGRCGLVDFEMGPSSARLLLEDLGATAEEVAALYYVTPDGPPEESDLAAMVDAGVTLAVVDAAAGAYDAAGLDDNKRSDVERFGRVWVRPLWQRGCTTVMLDHVVKQADARGRFAIGSERKLGGVDVQLGLEAVRQLHRGGSGTVRVSTLKDRPGHLGRPHVGEFHFTSDPVTHRIEWQFIPSTTEKSEERFRPTALMERASHALEVAGEPLGRTALAKRFDGKREWKFAAIACLLDEGYAHDDDGRITFVHPFTEDNGSLAVPSGSSPGSHPVPKRFPAQFPAPVPPVPPPYEGGTREPAGERRLRLGDPMYVVLLAEAQRDNHITYREAQELNTLHRLVEAATA